LNIPFVIIIDRELKVCFLRTFPLYLFLQINRKSCIATAVTSQNLLPAFCALRSFPFFTRAVVDWCVSLEKDLLPKQKFLARPKVHAALRQCPRSPGQSARPRLWRTNKPRTRTRPRFRLRSRPRPRLRFRVRAILSELPRFFFKGPKVNSEFKFDDEIQGEPDL